jgi:hypothetical protein
MKNGIMDMKRNRTNNGRLQQADADQGKLPKDAEHIANNVRPFHRRLESPDDCPRRDGDESGKADVFSSFGKGLCTHSEAKSGSHELFFDLPADMVESNRRGSTAKLESA